MRSAKPSIVIGAVCAFAFSTCAVAGALISGTSGQVIWLTSAPSSVALNAKEDATSVFAFNERQGVTLTAALPVNVTDPGTYGTFSNGTKQIAAGTQVDSLLLHSDPPGNTSSPRRTGTVTVATDIIGVIASTARLNASDSVVGAPGTTYAAATSVRGLEADSSGARDLVTISANRRTLSFDIKTAAVDDIRVITRHADVLTTQILDTPDPVTAGNDVRYTLVVTNAGASPVADAHVKNTLPAGTTLASAASANGCTGSAPVDCDLGPLGVNGTATATVVVTVPLSAAGTTITDTAVAAPTIVAPTTETTAVEAPEPGVSKGYVGPGGSIDTSGDDPATVTLPNTGPGAPILITQGPGTFCDGPCSGPATTISEFPGYTDPDHPIALHLVFTFPDSPTSLTDAATAFGSTIYKNDDPNHPNVGVPVADCATPGSSVATPHPCVDGHTISQPFPNSFVVTFDIVYLSGDPKFALR